MKKLIALLLALITMPVHADPVADAFVEAFPIYEMARTRQQTRGTAAEPGIQPANFLAHRGTLADASSRGVTTPNNDTLYSSAWLDLADGPVVLTIPALPSRYHSAALMDARTDHVAVLGTRMGKPGRVAILGPDWKGAVPPGDSVVRMTSNDGWLLVRVLVDGTADLAAAGAAQRQFSLDALGNRGRPTTAAAPANPDAPTFVNVVGEALARNPGMASKALAAGGLVPGVTWATLPEATRAAFGNGFAGFNAALKGGIAATGVARNGWVTSRPGIGTAAASAKDRAMIALGGLAALPREEAMYFTARVDADGAALEGGNRYVLRLPKDALPLDGFWSLSMYKVEPDGRQFFVDNAVQRFAIGDRSPGLVRGADGSTEILIQRLFPAVGDGNWLPAPAGGPFSVVLRTYLPKKALLSGAKFPPPLTRLRD